LRPPPSSTLFPYTTLFRSNTDLADRIPILRGPQNSHVSGKEVAQNVLESRLQLTAARGKQNVRLREPERQIRLDELGVPFGQIRDRKSTRLNSSHLGISYA